MQKIDLNSPSGAVISRCNTFRYALWRTWDVSLPRVLFICLNPSIADAKADDPTLIRCINFAKQWGYGGVQIGNLFAYRSTDPAALNNAKNPVGRSNDQWLQHLTDNAELVVAAWGNDGKLQGRGETLQRNFPALHCLKLNKSGQPAHPLYLRSTLTPFPMNDKKIYTTPALTRSVATRFAKYPADIKGKAESLRALIYEVASNDPEIGPLEETLKWRQPSFLTPKTGSGTTIRIDWREKQPEDVVMFLNCRTSLVDAYRSLFPGLFAFEGTRAVVIEKNRDIAQGEVRDALAICISMALRYHLDK